MLIGTVAEFGRVRFTQYRSDVESAGIGFSTALERLMEMQTIQSLLPAAQISLHLGTGIWRVYGSARC
jgi:hypothetical protein